MLSPDFIGAFATGVETASLWASVDRILERAAGLDALRAHALHVLEARRRQRLGLAVPPALQREERGRATMALLVPALLDRVRNAYDGRVMVLKGPEVACLYPSPWSRPFGDLDLLVDDAGAARRALLGAGFQEIGDPDRYVDLHHLTPLLLRDLPIPVELHSRPKWVSWGEGPAADELLSDGVPSRLGVDGVLRPPDAHHALLIAAHSWAHEPFRRALDLVDALVLSLGADDEMLASLARCWGIGRMWDATTRVSAAMLGDRSAPLAVRAWAQNVLRLEERTVLQVHLARWLSPYAARPPAAALHSSVAATARLLVREPGDTWRRKSRRAVVAVRNAARPRSEHDRELERRGLDAGATPSEEGGS